MKTVFVLWVKSGTIYIAYSQLTMLVHCKFLSTGCYTEQIVDDFVSELERTLNCIELGELKCREPDGK